MAGTRLGGKKSAAKIGKKELAERGRKGGVVKAKKGFAVTGDAKAKGSVGGKAKAAKYQNPNFDKDAYWARRKQKQRGQEPVRKFESKISPDELLRRTNPKEYNKQRGVEGEEG